MAVETDADTRRVAERVLAVTGAWRRLGPAERAELMGAIASTGFNASWHFVGHDVVAAVERLKHEQYRAVLPLLTALHDKESKASTSRRLIELAAANENLLWLCHYMWTLEEEVPADGCASMCLAQVVLDAHVPGAPFVLRGKFVSFYRDAANRGLAFASAMKALRNEFSPATSPDPCRVVMMGSGMCAKEAYALKAIQERLGGRNLEVHVTDMMYSDELRRDDGTFQNRHIDGEVFDLDEVRAAVAAAAGVAPASVVMHSSLPRSCDGPLTLVAVFNLGAGQRVSEYEELLRTARASADPSAPPAKLLVEHWGYQQMWALFEDLDDPAIEYIRGVVRSSKRISGDLIGPNRTKAH